MMEAMADNPEVSWRSPSFRQNVRTKIEEVVKLSGNPTTKSVAEMETHVYQKAKNKEEYLSYVARLIIHVREMNSKNSMTGGGGSGGQQGGGGGVSDPMSALKSMAGQGGGTVTIQSQPGQTQLTAQHLGSGGTISQMAPQQQPGMNPMVMQQARFLGPGGVLAPQQVQQRPQMMPSNVQLLQKFRQQSQGPPNVTSTQIPMQGNYNENMFMQSQQSPLSTQFQGHSPAPATMSNQGPNSNQSAVPSPVGHLSQNMGHQMTQSPAVYGQSPNPQIAPSPASSYSVRTPGAPSPGSALNTPISAGAAPSPINRTQEELYHEKRKQLLKFVEPLKQMIASSNKDDTSSVTNNLNKKKEINRMTSLLEILMDPNKRCTMDVLVKCEQALERMVTQNAFQPTNAESRFPYGSSQPQPTYPTKTQEQNICQPLIDALNNISKSPMFNHVLDKTFGPPLTALFGSSIRSSSPLPKRRKVEEDSAEISDVLQGEIARLDQKFKVQLDPVQHLGSYTVNLICQLDDKNLPCVPSISIMVPKNYPEKPPQCYTTKDEYESTSVLQTIQQVLTTRLSTMPPKYSITSLLDTWEMSVRQACSSKPIAVEN